MRIFFIEVIRWNLNFCVVTEGFLYDFGFDDFGGEIPFNSLYHYRLWLLTPGRVSVKFHFISLKERFSRSVMHNVLEEDRVVRRIYFFYRKSCFRKRQGCQKNQDIAHRNPLSVDRRRLRCFPGLLSEGLSTSSISLLSDIASKLLDLAAALAGSFALAPLTIFFEIHPAIHRYLTISLRIPDTRCPWGYRFVVCRFPSVYDARHHVLVGSFNIIFF